MKSNSSGSRRSAAVFRAAFLTIACGLLALPFYWMLVTSLKGPAERPEAWWPAAPTLDNYRAVLETIPLGRMYLNSIVTSALAAALQVGLALPMAYAFARVRLPGSRTLFLVVLSTLFVPEEMKLIPNFLLMNQLGWSDSYAALILPVAAHAFPVLVLHEHIRRLPRELFEAGAMDGATHVGLLTRVVLPQSSGLLAALWMVALAGRWNDYLWPLVVVERPEMQTLTLGLAAMKNAESAGLEWGRLMAAAALSALPLAVVFAVFQRLLVPAWPAEPGRAGR